MPKATDYTVGSHELVKVVEEAEASLRFSRFDPQVAFELGSFMRTRFAASFAPDRSLYIQIRSFPARPGAPFVLFAALAGDPKMGTGIAYQIEGKARAVEHSGSSTLGSKAFAAMMGWPTTKMGFMEGQHIVNGGGFPIRLRNCPSPVGVIVVSGLPDIEDHQFIVDSLEEFLPKLE